MPPDPDEIVTLTSARSELDAGLLVSILDSHGVPAFSPSSAATTLRWEVGASDPYKIYVRRRDAERARQIIAQERSGSIDIDWDEVDVGEESPDQRQIPARTPGSPGLVIVLVLGAILFVVLVVSAMSGATLAGR